MWDILHSRAQRRRDASAGGASVMSSDTGADTPPPGLVTAAVNFKDLSLTVADGDDSDEGEVHTSDQSGCSSPQMVMKRRTVRSKQVIIMVGLPGRGKTWLCHKLRLYLNWLGHATKHINVGSYRRQQKPSDEIQTADFFDATNEKGIEARSRALREALLDLHAYLGSDTGQIVIFDATNTTEERRQWLVQEFHGRYQYLFIESICNDTKVLEENYVFKMKFSPDYEGADSTQQAIEDFKARVAKYEEVYEPMTNRNVHYIRLIDMVTGRGYMDVNRISGYIPGKIVFFLMQVCKAGLSQTRKIWLTRHGESEYNNLGKIGGDSNLSPRGEEYARLLPQLLYSRLPERANEEAVALSVWTSTLKRTIQTAHNLPFPKLRWKALDEIQAGLCDGLTYAEISERFPDEFEARAKDKLRYRYQAGESYLDVIMRLEPVIIEMEREKECICVVSHQAVLRAVLGYFMGIPIEEIPSLKIPLHTLIELRPFPDGRMEVEHFPLNIPKAEELNLQEGVAQRGPSLPADCVGSASVRTASGAVVSTKMPAGPKIPFGATAVSPAWKPSNLRTAADVAVATSRTPTKSMQRSKSMFTSSRGSTQEVDITPECPGLRLDEQPGDKPAHIAMQ